MNRCIYVCQCKIFMSQWWWIVPFLMFDGRRLFVLRRWLSQLKHRMMLCRWCIQLWRQIWSDWTRLRWCSGVKILNSRVVNGIILQSLQWFMVLMKLSCDEFRLSHCDHWYQCSFSFLISFSGIQLESTSSTHPSSNWRSAVLIWWWHTSKSPSLQHVNRTHSKWPCPPDPKQKCPLEMHMSLISKSIPGSERHDEENVPFE